MFFPLLTMQRAEKGARVRRIVMLLRQLNKCVNHHSDELCLSLYMFALYVWLQLLQVDFLSRNFRLSELYLQDNRLHSIAGAIAHLRSLEILFLHNNQLQNLEEVAYEFRHLTGLKILSKYTHYTHF